MQGGRATHRIASSPRRLLSETHARLSGAPCNPSTPSTRWYNTPAKVPTRPTTSKLPPLGLDGAQKSQDINFHYSSLLERLRRRQNRDSISPRRREVEAVSLQGYQSASRASPSLPDFLAKRAGKRSHIRASSKVDLASAFGEGAAEQGSEVGARRPARPREPSYPQKTSSRALRRDANKFKLPSPRLPFQNSINTPTEVDPAADLDLSFKKRVRRIVQQYLEEIGWEPTPKTLPKMSQKKMDTPFSPELDSSRWHMDPSTWPDTRGMLKRALPPRITPTDPPVVQQYPEEIKSEPTPKTPPNMSQTKFNILFSSELGSSEWPQEPWADAVESLPDRTLPPHITPTDPLAEGVIGTDAGRLTDVAPKSEHLPVATLSHGLERVLFNPGVHWLQDPRSRVYNFTPWLEEIPKVNDFAFERLSGFVKSSRDQDLRALAVQENRKFAGSTSSMSGMLSHIYFLLSEHKDVETETLSRHFASEPSTFTMGQRMPAAVALNYKDGHYAIDSYAGGHDDSDKNVLTWLGTLLENFLTKSPKEFKTFLREESAPIKPNETPIREAYRYAKSDKFVMRSQLDCHDPRLPGTGVFDLKTRACVSIRHDILNYEENAGYMIKTQHGLLESFEREYYDLIRSAFLKYSFQVRIGNMDGVMVAYHNTERIYGFQYISLDEMDERLYGSVPGIGDKIFGKCIGMLEAILEEATKLFPEQSIICYFETPTAKSSSSTVMDVYVEPQVLDEKMAVKPVEQLSVSVKHFLGGEEVRSRAALRSIDEEWTVKYEIEKANLAPAVTRSSLDLLNQRKYAPSNRYLPSHIDPEDAEEFWGSLNFGAKSSGDPGEMTSSSTLEMKEDSRTEERGVSGQGSEESSTPQADGVDENDVKAGVKKSRYGGLFATPNKTVRLYRQMSREGRLEYEKIKEAEKGKPKILLGHGVYTPEEESGNQDAPSRSFFSRLLGK